MSNLHKDLANSELHDPKDFSTASNNQKPVKNNSGTYEWVPAIMVYETTITNDEFTAASMSEVITRTGALPAGAVPMYIKGKVTEKFEGGGATSASLGFDIDNNLFDNGAGNSVFLTPSATAGFIDRLSKNINDIPNHTSAQNLDITLTSDVNVNTLTAGSVTIWITYIVLT